MSYSWDKDAEGKLNVNVIGVRNFAPLEGFPEEAATGSASGAMACFITKNILADILNKSFANVNKFTIIHYIHNTLLICFKVDVKR